jgi:hypothetical protein
VGLPFACFFSLMASLAMQGIYCVRDQMEDPFVQSISAERISLGGEFHNLCVNHSAFTFAFEFWVAVLTRSSEGPDLPSLKFSSRLSVRLYQACIYANQSASSVTCQFSGNVCCAASLNIDDSLTEIRSDCLHSAPFCVRNLGEFGLSSSLFYSSILHVCPS